MYKHLNVQNKCLKRSYPVTHTDICSWEHKQGILLPEDLRNFYSCTNGFTFTWTFNLMSVFATNDPVRYTLQIYNVNSFQIGRKYKLEFK